MTRIDVRIDALVAALLARDGARASALARAAGCSPDTVVRTRDGRTPRPALRARLIGLARDRLPPDALAAIGPMPEPADHPRRDARSRLAPAHALGLELARIAEGTSPCGAARVPAAHGHRPVEPDELARTCPTCLPRARER